MTRTIRIAHITTVDSTLRFVLRPQLIRLRDEGYDVTAISAPGPWTAGIEADGIRHIPWRHATRSWNPSSDVLAFRELLQIFRRERFDLVHTHNPKPGILGRIAARLARVPRVVNTVHGLYATPEDSAARRIPVLALERLAARCSDLELYVNQEDLEWAKRIRLVTEAHSAYLGNGVDVSAFEPALFPAERRAGIRKDLGIPEDTVVVGTVARLVAEKGYRELFAAARTLREAFPQLCFLAVGPADPQKADAIGEAEIDGARRSVTFLGERQDIPSLLAIMDVFVLPSWREGLPLSAIEAAAMGKALVLTDIRGCREVARPGLEGLLVPPREAGPLAEAIKVLLMDAALRERLGAAARTRALERFDQSKVADSLVAHYRELLPDQRSGRPRRRHTESVPTR